MNNILAKPIEESEYADIPKLFEYIKPTRFSVRNPEPRLLLSA